MHEWQGSTYRHEQVERRKHRRFQTRDGALAALSFQFAVLGRIMDVSSGGLAFRYVASAVRSTESSKLNILLTDRSFCLDKVPFKSVWDLAIPGEFSSGSITLRQCGVKFGRLTHGQELGLGYFIRKCILGELKVQ
jgi:hypothetical protein